MANFYSQVDSNRRKSFAVVLFFIVFVVAVSYIMSLAFDTGLGIVGLALVFSSVSSIFSYYFSDKLILSISGARPATREEFFDFYTVTENLVMSQQMLMPKLYVIQDTAMNAFATGRNPEHAVVCVTTGLMSRLNRTELEGVVAHELAHIKNNDILLMSIVTILVGMIALLADWMLRMSAFGGGRKSGKGGGQLQVILVILGLVLAILSPIIAQMIQLAISRRREFLADAAGAAMTKYPEGLAKALEKISIDTEPLEAANKATAHLYIANPLKNVHGGIGLFASFFHTHPPVADRIQALRGEV